LAQWQIAIDPDFQANYADVSLSLRRGCSTSTGVLRRIRESSGHWQTAAKGCILAILLFFIFNETCLMTPNRLSAESQTVPTGVDLHFTAAIFKTFYVQKLGSQRGERVQTVAPWVNSKIS